MNENIHLEFQVGDRFYVIFEATEEEGYMYDIYDSKASYDAGNDPLDGGLCTGSINDALEMALN